MNLSVELYFVVALLLIYVNGLIVIKLMMNRLKTSDHKERSLTIKQEFLTDYSETAKFSQTKKYGETYKQLRESIRLDHFVQGGDDPLDQSKLEDRNRRRLNSPFKLKRMEGAVELSFIGSPTAKAALETAINKESDTTVKLYMANALADINHPGSIPVLIASLFGMHLWYRRRVITLIINFGEEFIDFLPQIIHCPEVEIKELIVASAQLNFSKDLRDYLIGILEQGTVGEGQSAPHALSAPGLITLPFKETCGLGKNCFEAMNGACELKAVSHAKNHRWDRKPKPSQTYQKEIQQTLVYQAAQLLAKYYPSVIVNGNYIDNEDVTIKQIAVEALAMGNPAEKIHRLMDLLANQDLSGAAVNSMLTIIDHDPKLIQWIIKRFQGEKDPVILKNLSEILAYKINYFIMKLNSAEQKFAKEVIEQVLLVGKTSQVIDFLNRNKNIEIENELIALVKPLCNQMTTLELEFRQYLTPRILKKCGLEPYAVPTAEKIQGKDPTVNRMIWAAVIFMVLLFPGIYILRYSPGVLALPFGRQLSTYVIDFNYYIAYYSIAINGVYLVLLALSLINVRRQTKLWDLKTSSLLFKETMLPGVSIIAPAFNEANTIIESANSLLNLVYPDYELIIVNDGSSDQTLNILINTFDLKRVDFKEEGKLKTKRVRGVYKNRSMPKLVVVDKENGGKADSLNAGINKSGKEYFCGIDADSILEPDALLKLASRELDAGIETPALGGNVFPANGCTIEKGAIIQRGLPKNALARFQTSEYIRAFMAGRLGWAYSNCLLIISGAFGLFRKERVLDVGGYLTASGKFEKDTVGEDMELVVRIGRVMREKGLKYKIDYVYNANCWTEVPEDIKSLHKQRNRWHRGLIDILSFHRKLMFNPGYGRAGLIALPYFFLFEFIGPFIEMQGYIMVVLAIFLGLMNVQVALLLFITIILMGVFVSLASILIAQRDLDYLTGKDIGVLILYAILENFGARQIMSFWRFGATLRLLWKQDGWGKGTRKGFEKPEFVLKGQ